MKIAFGVLTHNVIDYDRVELLEQTLTTAQEAFPDADKYVLDNGSTDGTSDIVAVSAKGWSTCRNDGGMTTVGGGRNALMNVMLQREYDLIVMSDDDMVWQSNAKTRLCAFWSGAPDDVVLVSGYLEPQWPWNEIRGAIEVNGVRGLERTNAPGCAWSFKPSLWKAYGPMSKSRTGTDVELSRRLLADGKRMVQLELADHAGWGRSTLGNEAIKTGVPIDRARWGLT